MMKNIFLIAILFCTTNLIAQVNETPQDRYIWGKKQTEFQDGYVILRNGKRLEGKIQLLGKPNEVSKLVFLRDGKELELDLVNLKAYGLNVSQLINDSPDEMYGWKQGITKYVNGVNKTSSSTKNMKGYLILVDGRRREGILHLNAINNVLDEFVIKTETEGKLVFKPAEVSRYGLNPLISDITKGGERTFDEEAKNFRNGYVVKSDGLKLTGIVAFMKASGISGSDADFYQTVFYTTAQETPLTVLGSGDLLKVVQLKGDTEVVYVPYNGGFVLESQVSSLEINEQFKLFLPGKIILNDKTELTGEVAQMMGKGEEYATTIKFKSKDGTIKDYDQSLVSFFEQLIKTQPYHFISFDNRFVYLIFDGDVLAFHKNPSPTTVNEKASSAARFGASLAGSVGSAGMVNSVKGGTDAQKQRTSEAIANSSKEDLSKANDQINKMKESNALDKEAYNDATKVQAAMAMESSGRELSESIVILNTEYFIWNKKTNEKLLIIKSEFSDDMEKVLKTCDKYIALPKEEQKKCRKLANIASAMKVLDDCSKK